MVDLKKATPGSDLAVENGCTCPVLDNNHGKYSEYGDDAFWVNMGCPLHGNMVEDEQDEEENET